MEIKHYTVYYTKKAIKDIQSLKAAKLASKTQNLCNSLQTNPIPPNSKQLSGDLKGKHSIRINLKHRLVYEVFEKESIIKILSMWNHYGDN
jgi:Txe/YoeB family toxin of toxin-antitoxin system